MRQAWELDVLGREKKNKQSDAHKNMVATINKIFEQTESVRKDMEDDLELFRGNVWRTGAGDAELDFKLPGKSDVQFNIVFSTIQAMAPLITDNRPIPHVSAEVPFLDKIAQRLNGATKYAWEVLDLKAKVESMVLDGLVMKRGILETGYDPVEGPGGQVTVKVIDPRTFFQAPGYKEIDESPFCGVKEEVPVSWVRRNFPEVKEVTGVIDGVTKEKIKAAYKFGDVSGMDEETTFVTLYRVWTKDEMAYEEISSDGGGKKYEQKYPYGKMCYFSTEQYFGEVAIEEDHGLPPWVDFTPYENPHDAIGFGVVDSIKSLARELNALLKSMVEYTRRHLDPNVFVDVAHDPNLIENYKKTASEGGQAYPFDSLRQNPASLIVGVPEPQQNPMVHALFQMIPAIIEEMSGMTDVSKGHVGKQERQSASELAILLESSQTRIRGMVRRLERTIERMFYRLVRNMMQYYTKPRWMRWKETDGQEYAMYGNSFAQAKDMMKPKELPPLLQARVDKGVPLDESEQKLVDQYLQEYQDMRDFLEYFSTNEDGEQRGDLDPVYFPFNVSVQADSMLPADKQSRANMAIRLAEMKIIDPPAVLDILDWPGRQEIMERREQAQQQAQQQKKQPQNPQMLQQLKAAQGARNG